MSNQSIQCPHCTWSILKRYKNKRGQLRNGYNNYLEHLQSMHPERFEQILKDTGKKEISELFESEQPSSKSAQRFNWG